ncbi:cell wall hydrolase [Acetobacteraceae bacterium]|nr:cell wall hydrolase [Candidatus Parcubacteria bacterium]
MFEYLLALSLVWSVQINEKFETAFLAANIYHEARGEPKEGQICIAYVTLDRAYDNKYYFGGPSIRSVVFKKNIREDGRETAEFSWWEHPSIPTDHHAMQIAWQIAKGTRSGSIARACNSSVRFYKNSSAAGPGGTCWFDRNTIFVETRWNHDFYRPHRSAPEWWRGTSQKCYTPAATTSADVDRTVARLPRPRPERTAMN